ncbi:MAG: hypothetical protein IKU16_06710 [Muribaculaceae bacterium]|nr:hypothetical protein [Muribaculaceae bacterium]
MSKRVHHIICILMLAVFVSYWSGITMFGHIHEVDGASIVHSHPGANTHDHSASSFFTINAISHFISDDASLGITELAKVDCSISEIHTHYLNNFIAEPHRGFISLRAPPTV